MGICGTPWLTIPLPIIPLTQFGGLLSAQAAVFRLWQGNEWQRNGFPDFIPLPFIRLPQFSGFAPGPSALNLRILW
jgi:hypothetical protein